MNKILLVEDNELNRDMLSRRLKRRGYDVTLAIDGEEAVQIALTEPFNLILMDMSLPVMDGWEATRTLKAHEQTQNVPIIALTAHAMVGDQERSLAAGCDDYDTKPVDLKRLLAKIEAFLGQPTLPAASARTEEFASQSTTQVWSQPQPTLPLVTDTLALTDLETCQLLIVDDHEANRDMLSRRLQRHGHEVIAVDSGMAALEQLRTNPQVALVLLDVMMPGMDGIETLQRIRQTRSQLQLPVVMVTAKSESDDVVRAFEAGANDYITKPIDFAVAIARIQTHLQTHRLTRQAARQQPQGEIISAPVTPNPAPVASPQIPLSSLPTDSGVEAFPLLNHRYQLDTCLVSGALTSFVTARDIQSSESPTVLIQKIQIPELDSDQLSHAQKFILTQLETLQKLTQIAHPFDWFEQDQTFYLVQPFITGTLLSQELASKQSSAKQFSLRQTLQLTQDLLYLLDDFHQCNIIHSDLHPHHLMRRSSDQQLCLIDSGIAKRLLIELGQQSSRCRQILISQRDYQAIEQRIGRPTLSSDLFAVGIIALQAFTGKAPTELVATATGSPLWQSLMPDDKAVVQLFEQLLNPNHLERYPYAKVALQAVTEQLQRTVD